MSDIERSRHPSLAARETLHGYVAGPMTGYPRFNFDAFDDMATSLRSAGYVVISPADLSRGHGVDPDGPADQCSEEDYAMFMRTDIAALMQADFIVALPGWERSKGARAELHVARAIGLQAFDHEMEPLDLGILDERKPE